MNRIYLEPRVMTQPTGSDPEADDAAPSPGAAEALGHLADSYELVVLGEAPAGMLDALHIDVVEAAEIPPDAAHGSWLITDDPASCANRPPGLRTILIGPRRPPSSGPQLRCDLEARDLGAAVVEILTREAMTT
jgi:hypothetical protein